MRAPESNIRGTWLIGPGLAVVATLAWAQAPAPPQNAGRPVSSSRDATHAGDLYVSAGCLACHGERGEGSASGARIAGTNLGLEQFIARVRTPPGTMPPQRAEQVSNEALAAIHAWLRSASGSMAPHTTALPGGNAEAGAVIYERMGCYSCHSNQAQGGAQGPRIGPEPLPLAAFVAYVRNPGGDMPPYSPAVMSDQDLAHVREWLAARRRPPRLSDVPLLAP